MLFAWSSLQDVENELQVETRTLAEPFEDSKVAQTRVDQPHEDAFSWIFDASAHTLIKRIKEELDLARRRRDSSPAEGCRQMREELKTKTVGLQVWHRYEP